LGVNPFLINTYVAPEYFCDRETETQTLINNIKNQSNTAFFAQRRLGKTALIQHTFHLLRPKKTVCIYLDIYATLGLKELANQMANAIYKEFPPEKSIGKRFMEAIKVLRPVISFDELSGAPELSLDITKAKQFEKTIPQLLQFLDEQHVKVVIAIDEFQQILNYPEQNVEAILRTAIQPLKHINFIFCGSNQHLMHQIFNNGKRPFYASTKNINLQKIDPKLYGAFIKKHFELHKFKINQESIDLILELTYGHTYYTQLLCHELFAGGATVIKKSNILLALGVILMDNQGTYFQYRNLLTAAQWNLLKALAKEGKVSQPYSQNFIYNYRLGNAAGVKRSLESLLEKEMIYHNISEPLAYYEVHDKFLLRWLQKN
jgi:uncharacterized protein